MAEKSEPMTPDEVKAAVSAEIARAVGYAGSDLAGPRDEALRYYLGEPYGTERPGRSTAVTREVADTVEWIMPQLLRIFAGSDDVVRFTPTGPEDEAVADQCSDYVNWIFTRDNPGFVILYDWFKDALLQRQGVVKAGWDTAVKVEERAVEGLSADELTGLLSDPELEVIQHSVRPDPVMGEAHDLRFRRRRAEGRVVVEAIPPEEFLVSPRARRMEDPFLKAHRVTRTVSELRAEGYPAEVLERLGKDEGEVGDSTALTRNRGGMGPVGGPLGGGDPAMRSVTVTECWLGLDADGDGISELRRIVVAGETATEVLSNEVVDEIPFADLTPIRMPHRMMGLSVADLVKDVQLIKSTILRQMLDSLYHANNPRVAALENAVNLDDLLTNRPGGVVRVKTLDAVRPLSTEWVGAQSLPMLDYMDRMGEGRTGVSRSMQGLDMDILSRGAGQTAAGVSAMMGAAQARIELMARLFAETGVKRLFRLILWLITRHQDKARVVRLRGQWVPMDPRGWNAGMDVSVDVGLGSGTRAEQTAIIREILAAQKEILAAGGLGGMVTPVEVRNALSRLAQLAGLKAVDPYFRAPSPPAGPETAPQPPQPTPDMLVMAQVEQAKLAQRDRMAQAELALKRDIELAKIASQERIAQAELGLKAGELRVKAAETVETSGRPAGQGMGVIHG